MMKKDLTENPSVGTKTKGNFNLRLDEGHVANLRSSKNTTDSELRSQ